MSHNYINKREWLQELRRRGKWKLLHFNILPFCSRAELTDKPIKPQNQCHQSLQDLKISRVSTFRDFKISRFRRFKVIIFQYLKVSRFLLSSSFSSFGNILKIMKIMKIVKVFKSWNLETLKPWYRKVVRSILKPWIAKTLKLLSFEIFKSYNFEI